MAAHHKRAKRIVVQHQYLKQKQTKPDKTKKKNSMKNCAKWHKKLNANRALSRATNKEEEAEDKNKKNSKKKLKKNNNRKYS